MRFQVSNISNLYSSHPLSKPPPHQKKRSGSGTCCKFSFSFFEKKRKSGGRAEAFSHVFVCIFGADCTRYTLTMQVSYGHNSDQQQPTLQMVSDLLNSITLALERVGEEKYLLLNKIRDLNELSRKEVDEIIKVCMKQDCISPNDDIRKRRYIAMIDLCCMAGNRDQLITLLLQIAECAITILLVHFHDEVYAKDLSSSDELLPVLEKLEHLKEDKVGRSLKLFHRSVTTLKEMTIRSMAL
uniref:Uncharacterized protein n=1 Tax=Arundo donax TaxID=35708 RepID=A0A0A9D591_ARUDO